MRIKQFLLNCLPVSIYNSVYNKRHPDLFTKEYLEGKCISSCHNSQSLSEIINYKSIVSVQGLGFSGSGAVLDFLCEVDSCNVIGSLKKKANENDHCGLFECDFLRLAGGLFEFEKYLGSSNVFHNDAIIKRLIKYLNSFPLFKKDYEVRKLFYYFFDNIIQLRICEVKGNPYNNFLYKDGNIPFIFFLKSFTITEYRHICKNFLANLFSYLNRENDDILVFDQLLCDFEYDMVRYNDYIPDVKIIVVYRDPRDIYAYAREKNVEWIAHDNVDDFIKWFKIMTQKIDLTNKEYLIVQFERLITDYNNETQRIMRYLNIDNSFHKETNRKTIFNPSKSAKNIGIWQKSIINPNDFDIISKSLCSFCYNV